ncbi:MAG: exodeoxyribonuclease V subunit gamma, partial [Microthrixaceae bacterium]
MLHLHTSGRIEPLAEHLARVLSVAPADPMAPEWIAVPSEGMRRWLHLELARHLGAGPAGGDGIAANIERAYPASLRLSVLDAASGGDGADPWRVEHLVWSVLAELALGVDIGVDGSADSELVRVAEVPAGGSRYSRARRIADLFDRYHVHRTDMVLQWAEHRDVDGSGRPLAEHDRWQPQLWRRVRDRIATPSPPERLPELLVALHSGELQLTLPDRLAMFGLSVLPGGAGFLDLADAVGATRELHVFLLEPSPSAARHVAAGVDRPGDVARLRAEDRSAELVAHPLLRSWGRLHRETTVLLADGERQGVAPGRPVPDATPPGPASAAASATAASESTLLGRLQADLHLDRAPAGDLVVSPMDRSLELHAAHGDARQVEVLRDVLLHLLADDELALSEDDIVVMSPALDRLAPIIEAVLGPSADHGGTPGATPALRYRIADRSLRSATPLLDALDDLLAAVAGRFDAPTVLDLVALAPVRTRFGFSDDDVARIGEWAQQGRVRWGLDEQHRDRLGLPAEFDTNTWRAALDRLLMGVAVADDRHLGVGDVVPMALGGDDTSLVGRLGELVWRLEQLSAQVDRPRALGDWLTLVRHAVDHLLAVDRDDAWQMDALTRLLAELEEEAAAEAATPQVPLDFVDLRRGLGERLGAAPGRADFFRGGITISSMTPLRGVPHRVIVLLGVDQPAFAVGAP